MKTGFLASLRLKLFSIYEYKEGWNREGVKKLAMMTLECWLGIFYYIAALFYLSLVLVYNITIRISKDS